MRWTQAREAALRDALVKIAPEFKDTYKAGYFYKQVPLNTGRFYMRDTLCYLDQKRKKGDAILCYGCGVGTFLMYLWTAGYRNLLGRDADPRVVAVAHELIPAVVGAEIPVELVAPEAVYAISGMFDVVTLFEFLPYNKLDVAKVLGAAAACLQPGGTVFFDMHSRPVKKRPNWRHMSREAVAAAVAAAGLQIVFSSAFTGRSKVLYALEAA